MENKKINVQIIQPVVPKYRLPLFEALINDERLNVKIMAGKTEPGGVKSVQTDIAHIDFEHSVKVILKKLFWQKNLILLPQLSRGDVLIINGNIKFLSNYPLILEAKQKGISVVWWGHGWSSTTTKISFFIRKQFMKFFADALLLYTQKEKQMFLEEGFNEEKIFFMNNTIYNKDIEKIKENINQDELVSFKIQNNLVNKKILLFVGRLRKTPSTNLELVINALKSLGDDYRLVIIGDGEEKSNFIKLSKELEISKKILFLGAIYEEKELAPWFMTADCFVYPGAIGLSLLHSFSYGLPVITNDRITTHGPEIAALDDNANGKLFIKNDEKSLIEAISVVSKNKDFFKKNALSTIRNDFSFDKTIQRVTDCIVSASKINIKGKQ